MRGATVKAGTVTADDLFQSTLPMRGATNATILPLPAGMISIHAPHAGSDTTLCSGFLTQSRFQSTLPMRGATRKQCCKKSNFSDFNPRSPCGERRDIVYKPLTKVPISIHAPHAGSDYATVLRADVYHISIHAPHAGSDYRVTQRPPGGLISIHAPHAGSD